MRPSWFGYDVGWDGDAPAVFIRIVANHQPRRWFSPMGGRLLRCARLLAAGLPIRMVRDLSGCSYDLASRVLERLREQRKGNWYACPCDRDAGHKGWCWFKLERSTARQRLLAVMHENQRQRWACPACGQSLPKSITKCLGCFLQTRNWKVL